MKITNFFNFFLLSILLVFFSRAGWAQYSYEVVARTGLPINGSPALTDVGRGPSINDAGKVAFVARDQVDGQGQPVPYGRVMLVNKTAGVERDYYLFPGQVLSNYLQVNNLDNIAFSNGEVVFQGDTFVQKLLNNFAAATVGVGSYLFSNTPLEYVDQYPTINNTAANGGFVVFGGDIKGNVALKTTLAGRANGSDAYSIVPPGSRLAGFPELFPMIDDYGETIVRFGGSPTSPLWLFTNTSLTNVYQLPGQSPQTFTYISPKPGISDDGYAVAVMADRTTGRGIYVYLLSEADFTYKGPFKIASVSAASSLDYRVGVNRVGTSNDFILVYLARNTVGHLTLYSQRINAANPNAPVIYPAVVVAEEGQTLGSFVITIADINIYDPINQRGELAFYIRTAAGTRVIIRALPQTNRPPVLNSITTPQSVVEGTDLAINVSASDPDGGPLVLSAVIDPRVGSEASFTDNGNGTGTFRFRPLPFQVWDSFSFRFRVTDNGGLFSEQTIAVNVKRPGRIVSPDLATPFNSSTVNFNWAPGTGVNRYSLYLGLEPGKYNILVYNGTGTSATATGIPLTGRHVYLRLYSNITINGVARYYFYDYEYQTQQQMNLGQVVTPVGGTRINTSQVTFIWENTSMVDYYQLTLGTTPGGQEITSRYVLGTARSLTVPIPLDGRTLYVGLGSRVPGARDYQFNRYTYQRAKFADLVSPVNGAILTSSNVTFTWDLGIDVTSYGLLVGTTGLGSSNLVNQPQLSTTSWIVNNIPAQTPAQQIFVTLISRLSSGEEQRKNYIYETVSHPAEMISPVAGAHLGYGPVEFTWTTGEAATAYYLSVGNSAAYDTEFFGQNMGLQRRATVTLSGGGPYYVKLSTLINGRWINQFYIY